MAVDMYLELDGIQGESAVKTNAIDIDTWNFGITQTGTSHVATGGGAGTASFSDIHISKKTDKSSPTLMLKCARLDHLKKGKITCRKSGGSAVVEYYTVELEDVIVTSFRVDGHNGTDVITENIVLQFAKIKVVYTTQNRDGSKGAPVEFPWDISARIQK